MDNEENRKGILPGRNPNSQLSTLNSPFFPSPVAALGLVLLAFAGMQAASLLWHLLFPSARESVSARYVEILVQQCLMMALPVALYLLRKRPRATALRLRGLPVGTCLCLVLAAVATMFATSMFITLWALLMEALGLPMVGSGVPTPGGTGELWLSLLVIGIAPALCEELLFRGALLPSLEGLGTRPALVISGLVFALMHGQITVLPAHLLLGFVLGYLLVGYGSLLAPMLFHAAYNGASMTVSYLLRNITLEQAEQPALTAEVIAGIVPMMLIAGLAAWLLIRLPMGRAARGKNPPPRYEPSGERLPAGAKALLALLLFYFVFIYAANMLMAAHWAGVGAIPS